MPAARGTPLGPPFTVASAPAATRSHGCGAAGGAATVTSNWPRHLPVGGRRAAARPDGLAVLQRVPRPRISSCGRGIRVCGRGRGRARAGAIALAELSHSDIMSHSDHDTGPA